MRRTAADPSRILTIPNALSAIRVLLIPLFVLLLTDEQTRWVGMVLLGVLNATDWIDGWVARRFEQESRIGRILDPVADRLIVGTALIAFVVLDAFPLWAALLLLVRDGLILVGGVVLGLRGLPQPEVRQIGKIATFTLMWGVPAVAWGNFGLLFDDATLVFGWVWYTVGTMEYYAAAGLYATDLRAALRATPAE